MRKKDQWRIYDIYTHKSRHYNIKPKKSFWRASSRLGGLAKGGLTVLISVLMIYGIVQAGSLTPSASPVATMNSLADIAGSGFATTTHSLKALYDWLGTNVGGVKSALTGTYDASGVSSNASGNVMEQLKFIQQNLGGYTYGSSDAGKVLTTAGGTYNATLLTAANVRSGVAFGVSSTGTYGGSGWTYGSDDAAKVLTTADANNGVNSFNAANLSVGMVKSGVQFGVGPLSGEYPSATYTLPSAGATADLAASGGNISSSNGAVEWWQSNGTRQTATLDFPTLSNVCSGDTSNNSAGTLSVTAAYLSVGNTWCGTAGTLLANLFNGTSGAFTGGSQANGGADDYNNGGSAASGRYAMGWTACNAGNSYCGTSDTGADAKDDSTGLIWSMPCNGSGCASFSDATPLTYSWDSSAANNNSRTASQLCSDHAGWSLPHQKQLMQAYIDGSYGNLEASGVNRYYWSASTVSYSTTNAWLTYLSYGYTSSSAKTNSNYVRCVRSAI